MKKDANVLARLKLNASSAFFFSQLLANGHATFEKDESLADHEVHATVSKEGKSTKIKVHANGHAIVCAMNEAMIVCLMDK